MTLDATQAAWGLYRALEADPYALNELGLAAETTRAAACFAAFRAANTDVSDTEDVTGVTATTYPGTLETS